MSLQAIETRSIEDSINHGHDAISRAERLVSLIRCDLNGAEPPSAETEPGYSGGVVSSADRLAGRAEALVRELERIRPRIVSESPTTARANDYTSDKYVDAPMRR